jgi:hypothetical protein
MLKLKQSERDIEGSTAMYVWHPREVFFWHSPLKLAAVRAGLQLRCLDDSAKR